MKRLPFQSMYVLVLSAFVRVPWVEVGIPWVEGYARQRSTAGEQGQVGEVQNQTEVGTCSFCSLYPSWAFPHVRLLLHPSRRIALRLTLGLPNPLLRYLLQVWVRWV